MAGFSKAERQGIIDGYLAETGANHFQPHAFVDWLAGKPEHPAFDLFFGMTDGHAAREYRVALARNMASGLRIVARVQETASEISAIRVTTREFPAMVSPIDGRKAGGGYVSFDPNDPVLVSELRRQAAQALRSWLARYRGVTESVGVDLHGVEETLASLEDGEVDMAVSA